jgi:hypothetical protein
MKSKVQTITASLWVVALGASCIVPQQEAQCPTPGGGGGGTGDSAGSKTAVSHSNAPPAVKPSGPVISDGQSAAVQNVTPPGAWFAMNDRSAKGSMIPATTGDFPSAIVNGAIHTEGKGFSDWGGGIGFNFVGADSLTPLDASSYSGISFRASGASSIHFAMATVATMPEFGECTKCYDHFAVDITDLSATPKVYAFKWSQLRSGGWGAPAAAFDPHTLVGVNFTSKGPTPWNFTLDDIRFIP